MPLSNDMRTDYLDLEAALARFQEKHPFLADATPTTNLLHGYIHLIRGIMLAQLNDIPFDKHLADAMVYQLLSGKIPDPTLLVEKNIEKHE